jgi:hypothetical protein
LIHAKGRFAKFRHAFAQCSGVFGAVMGVQTESHLKLVHWLGGEAVHENLVQPAQDPVETFEPSHAVLHREARFGCGVKAGHAGKGRQVAVGGVFHKSGGLLARDDKIFPNKIQLSVNPSMKTPAFAEEALCGRQGGCN